VYAIRHDVESGATEKLTQRPHQASHHDERFKPNA
jgi:hypothetical protein